MSYGLRFTAQPPGSNTLRIDYPAAMDSNDEQAVIDAFVAAVHAGTTAVAQRAGKRLVKKIFKTAEWSEWTSVCDGTLLRADEIPPTPADRVAGVVGVEGLADIVSPERLAELEEELIEGESLTPDELAAWQKLPAENILTENPDCDVYDLWSVRSMTHSDGRLAFLADIGGGYSFTKPRMEFVAGTTTEEEALAKLRQLGFIGVEDFRARWIPVGVS